MWLSLKVENQSQIAMVNRQTMRPAWRSSKRVLTITTTTTLKETVVSSSERSIRVRYQIESLKTDVAGPKSIQLPPAWASPADIETPIIDITITPRATIMALNNTDDLCEETIKRAHSLGEDLRSCWVVPPKNSSPGQRWSQIKPASKESLQRGAKSIECNYLLKKLSGNDAKIEGQFETVLGGQKSPRQAIGSLFVQLSRNTGITKATRLTKIHGGHIAANKELQRSDLLIQRL